MPTAHQPMRFVALGLLFQGLGVGACTDGSSARAELEPDAEISGGSDSTTDALPTRDALDPPGCDSDDDCGDGWCVGEPGCDAVWTCTADIPCSAAAPSLVCGCDGRIFSAAAGCPGARSAWTSTAYTFVREGDPCDVRDPEGFRLDLTLVATGFEADEGRLLRARLLDPRGRDAPTHNAAMIQVGRVELRFYEAFEPAFRTAVIEVYVERDELPGCSGPDSAWRVEIPVGDADAVAELGAEGEPSPVTCESFE